LAPPPPPPSLVSWGRAHSLAGEGVGGSQFGRGDRHCGTLGINVLSGPIEGVHCTQSGTGGGGGREAGAKRNVKGKGLFLFL
jgi:hypothetical protein